MSTITINGAQVELDFCTGIAVHSVREDDLDAGVAPGPYDGQEFETGGKRYVLGEHDYQTQDGIVTCSAHIYEKETE